jgi:hypothetical protein
MSYSFVGATTPWRSEPGTAVSEFTAHDAMEAEAYSTAYSVSGKIAALRAQGETYAGVAYAYIDACMDFNARVGKVTFVPPKFQSAALQKGDTGDAPTVDAAPSSGSLASFRPTQNTASFTTGNAPAPEAGELPDAGDVGDTGSFAPPTAPGLGSINIPSPPKVTINVGSVPEPSPPSAPTPPDTSVEVVELMDMPTLPDISDTELEAAMSRLQSLIGKRVTIPQPTLRFPLIFEVVGSLLSGDLVVDAEGIVRQSNTRVDAAGVIHDNLMSRLWADRGFDPQPVIDAYNAVMRAQSEADRLNNNVATQGRWVNDALSAAYEVGVAAHGMMIDLLLSLSDAEFEALVVTAESQLELVKAGVAMYNGAAQTYRAQVARMEAQYAQATGGASLFRAQVGMEESKQQLNSAIADGFAATESIKRTQVKLFDAKVDANEATVRAFVTEMKALAERAKVLGEIDLAQYKAEVLAWTANVESIKGQLKQARNQARMVAAQNDAKVAEVRAGQVGNEAIAASAKQLAISISAQAGALRGNIEQASAKHVDIEAKNAVEAVIPAINAAKYEGDVSTWAATLDQDTGLLEGKAAEGSAAARFYVAALESLSRAAQLSQQGARELAEAYASAAEAAGRAGAAVESGRLSGFRASASLAASGTLTATHTSSVGSNQTYSESVSEGDTQTDKVKVKAE